MTRGTIWKIPSDGLPCYYEHRWQGVEPLGEVHVHRDDTGLWAIAHLRLDDEDEYHDMALRELERGRVKSFSIGYSILPEPKRPPCHVLSAELHEVSICAQSGADSYARIYRVDRVRK